MIKEELADGQCPASVSVYHYIMIIIQTIQLNTERTQYNSKKFTEMKKGNTMPRIYVRKIHGNEKRKRSFKNTTESEAREVACFIHEDQQPLYDQLSPTIDVQYTTND